MRLELRPGRTQSIVAAASTHRVEQAGETREAELQRRRFAKVQFRIDIGGQDGRPLGGRRIQAVNEIHTQIQANTRTRDQECRDFFKLNCKALFQTALLLTADALKAERALVRSIEELDVLSSPGQTSLATWERAVVMRSIEMAQLSSCAAPDPMTRHMLQVGLQPVIEIERFSRICFVLQKLLGYSTAMCAQLLNKEESAIRTLLQVALIQLQRTVVANPVYT
jgi:hypothetical protein